MNARKPAVFTLCLIGSMILAAAAPLPLGAQDRSPDRLQWFREAKFGLFIHWGVYSMIGREEWARQLLQIPLEEYQVYADNFNPVDFDPAEWAALARDAGVKYVIITSKHHDGFSIFDSAYTDYDIMKAKYGKDILGPLAAAMKRAAIPLGFYYSIMDWHHPDYLPRRPWEKDRTTAGADFGRYMDFAVNQLKELVAKYDPAVLWFDGEWEHSNEEQRAFAIEKMLVGMKPSLLINDRLFKREPGHGDFGTPENFVPATGVRNPDGTPRLWEACYTMNWNGWGYNRTETEFHSASQLIRQLIEIVSKGGNLLLNVGPQPDGKIQADFAARLRRMGEWLRTNGEAIYGTTASVFERLPFFGRCTVKGSTLYIHVMGWPADGKIRLPGLKTEVKKTTLLTGPGRPLTFRREAKDVIITLPERQRDPDATVVVVELQGPPVVEPCQILPGKDGEIELPVYLADIQSEMGQRAYLDYFYRTTMLANWQNVNDYPEWVFSTDKPGTYEVQASYASMWGGKAGYVVEVDGEKLAAETEPSPSVYFPATFAVGKIALKAGEHKLRVRITAITNNHAMNLEKIVLVPSPQAPAKTGWADSFAVDKKDFLPTGSNTYFRLEPGYRLKLEGREGLRRVTLVITVLEETRLVDGVETRVVEERETKSGQLAEVSRNFYAFNSADRGVYYFGEEVDIYKNGKVVGHEGAWESGKNGARFGLMMPDRPQLKARFYQEIAPGVAMDRAEVISLAEVLKTPAGEFKDCLKVAESNPLEGGGQESKLYAPWVGLIKDASLLLVEYGFPKK